MKGCRAGWAGRRVLIVGHDARTPYLAARIVAGGGAARLHPGPSLPVPARDEWIGVLPGRVDADGQLDGQARWQMPAPVANQAAGVLAAQADDQWRRRLEIPLLLYGNHPAFAWANAVPTAEAAVGWALAATPYTVYNSCIVVLGFGRVGRTTAERLRGFGGRVRVLCRPNEQPAARAAGFDAGALDAAASAEADMVINTIPAPVVDVDWLDRWRPDVPVLDLASPPGGFTTLAAAQLGSRLTRQPGAPARAAPATAAMVVADAWAAILREFEEGRLEAGDQPRATR